MEGKIRGRSAATEMTLDAEGGFVAAGIARRCWASGDPVREIFRRAFAGAGLPYYNPHSFRSMLVQYAMSLDVTPETLASWSINIGHAHVMTTLASYGKVPDHRRGELIRATVAQPAGGGPMSDEQIAMLQGIVSAAKAGAIPVLPTTWSGG